MQETYGSLHTACEEIFTLSICQSSLDGLFNLSVWSDFLRPVEVVSGLFSNQYLGWIGVWVAEYLRKEFIIASCRLSVKTGSKKLEEYKCTAPPLPHLCSFSLNCYREIRVYSSWWTRAALGAGSAGCISLAMSVAFLARCSLRWVTSTAHTCSLGKGRV